MYSLYFDGETVPRDSAVPFLKPIEFDPIVPHRGLKDPVKIAEDIEKRTRERDEDAAKQIKAQHDKMSLDPYGCRFVALAWADDDGDVVSHVCVDEPNEALALVSFLYAAQNRTLVGHNARTFDLPCVVARCRLLGIPVPLTLLTALRKRWDTSIIDTLDEVLLGQMRGDKSHVISRGLTTMCRVHGITIPDDDIDGAGIAQAAREGRWEDIRTRVTRDVLRVRSLAQKLGVTLDRSAEIAGVL